MVVRGGMGLQVSQDVTILVIALLKRRQGIMLRGLLCCSFTSFRLAAERQTKPKAKAQEQSAGSFLAGAAVNGLYTGLKFTGLAVRVASGLAASIGKDAEAAMARSREEQQAQRGAAEQVHNMHHGRAVRKFWLDLRSR